MSELYSKLIDLYKFVHILQEINEEEENLNIDGKMSKSWNKFLNEQNK